MFKINTTREHGYMGGMITGTRFLERALTRPRAPRTLEERRDPLLPFSPQDSTPGSPSAGASRRKPSTVTHSYTDRQCFPV